MRDMTQGSIPRAMLTFTLPLLLGNLFQQLYNFTDTLIVGRLVGPEALAAVGTAGAVMNLMLFVLVGMTLGASVLLSELFGAKDEDGLRRAYRTALVAGTALTAVLSAVSILLADQLIAWIQTPVEVRAQAAAYLRVTCAGLVCAFLYNVGAAALRAIGDTRAPLMFLIAAVTLNVGLDLFFVAVLRAGATGAAAATVIAQALSGAACLAYIQRRVPALAMRRGGPLIDWPLLKRTAGFAVTCAAQQAVLYAGRLLVQGAVNPLGVAPVAAFNGVTKIDSLILAPGDSLAMAQTTFTSQNLGAGKLDRPRTALRMAIGMGLSYCCVVAVLVWLSAGPLMRLFVGDGAQGVVDAGVSYLRVMALFYPLTALCNAFQGFFRGMGRMNLSLVSTFIQIPVRIALSYALARQMGLEGIALAVGIGWCCMVSFIIPAARKLMERMGMR